MKPISEMSLQECLEVLQDDESFFKNPPYVYHAYVKAITRRISDLTRWIPVEERLPTEADADENSYVLWWRTDSINLPDAGQWDLHSEYANEKGIIYYTHWKRIDKP